MKIITQVNAHIHKNQDISSITAVCPRCDLVQEIKKMTPGTSAKCARCGSTIRNKKKDSINKIFALSITGLILFFPASLNPIITLKILGEIKSTNLFTGINSLFNAGYQLTAVIVLFLNIIIPFFKITAIIYVATSIHFKIRLPHTITCFKAYVNLDIWGMQEVFLLGILVALTKLDSIATVIIGSGFYSFIALICTTTAVSAIIDKHKIWNILEKL